MNKATRLAKVSRGVGTLIQLLDEVEPEKLVKFEDMDDDDQDTATGIADALIEIHDGLAGTTNRKVTL